MNVQHSRSLLDVRLVEKLGHLPQTGVIGNVENNENRGQKYPLQGLTRFNQVVIKLQQDAVTGIYA